MKGGDDDIPGKGKHLAWIVDAAVAEVERTSRHCYREVLEHRETKTIVAADGSYVSEAGEIVRTEMFLCGALGPPCIECGAVSTVLCDFPIGEEARTCDRPLCERCAPTVGHDKNFCPDHMAMGAGPNMLLFKPPPPTREQLNELAKKAYKPRKHRLPNAPPADRRWRVLRDDGTGVVYAVTGWTTELEAKREQSRRGFAYFVESWDEYVAWHRKTYPLKRTPRRPRPK